MEYPNGCCQFWLKHPLGHSPLFMLAQCASGDCLVVTPTGQEVEQKLPPLAGGWVRVVLWTTFALGVIVGYRLLVGLIDWIRGLRLVKWVCGLSFSRPRGNWHRLASRALAFVNKRRLQQLQDLFPQGYLYCPTYFFEEEAVGPSVTKGKHSP